MITLYKGDDTQGQLGKKCIIKFHCDDAVDMTNVTVRFNLLNIVTKEFTNVNDGDELEVFVSHIDSRKLPLGIVYGKLWGEDSSGKIRTFANRIPFKLTTDLRCVYGSDGLDSVDIHVYSSVDWDSVANKPTLFPSKVSMVEGLEEALKQAGKVKTVNGQSPDENGNIEIELPSCKVTSVNGKDGDVELTAHDIPYGGEGASNVETAIELNKQAAVDNAEAIDSLEQQVGELKSDTYTKSEVDDKINQSAAHYLTKRAGTEGHYTYQQFATHADLAAAKAAHTEDNPQFFYGAEGHTPDKNDYCIVLADEEHKTEAGVAPTTRYVFVGSWDDNGDFRYQYTVNETPLSQEQWDALDSGITEEILGQLARKSDIPDEVTEETVSGWGFFKGTIETIKTALSTVFAALKHRHVKSDITDFPAIPVVVAPASDTALSGKAADAYETGKALAGKLDKSGGEVDFTFSIQSKDRFSLFETSYTLDGVKVPAYMFVAGEDENGEKMFGIGFGSDIASDMFAPPGMSCEMIRKELAAVDKSGDFVGLASIGIAHAVGDKLSDSNLNTLCTACGILLTNPDGTEKNRYEKLIDLFGQSNSQLAATIRAKVLADGEGEIKAALFADTAFKAAVENEIKSRPYLEQGAEGGIYVVIPEAE